MHLLIYELTQLTSFLQTFRKIVGVLTEQKWGWLFGLDLLLIVGFKVSRPPPLSKRALINELAVHVQRT